MPDFEIRLKIKNVAEGDAIDIAEGDAIDIAEEVWDRWAKELDAGLGDFEVEVLLVNVNGARFTLDWEPNQ